MKKLFTFMAMALLTFGGAYAQDEGEGETTPVVYTKTFNAVLSDAKSIVASEHYPDGRAELQEAITTAEAAIQDVYDNDEAYTVLTTLQAAIDAFVYTNKHANATEKVANPSFDKDNNNATTITSWTNSGFKQNRRSVTYSSNRVSEDATGYAISQFVEQWVATSVGQLSGSGDIQQVVTGLPAGHYRLTADILVVNQKTEAGLPEAEGVQLYANESVRDLGLTAVGGGINATAFSVDFDLAEGENATIGLRYADVNFNWLGWDNVTLFFIGDPAIYNSVVDAEKLVASKEALTASIAAAKEALTREDTPFYHAELEAAIETAEGFMEATTYAEVDEAKAALDGEVKAYNDYNKHYTNLKTAIANAEALVASGELTEGTDEYNAAIEAAKAVLSEAAENTDVEGAIAQLDGAVADLQKAEGEYRVANASYAHPANVITNGSMNSTDGWDILVPGANPGLHINTSGNVTNFSKPFMECWVNNVPYGQENYARQTITALPNGLDLPKGYYVLKAVALATRQDQADLKVSGVTLKIGEDEDMEEKVVQTANGVGNIYTIGYDKQTAGGDLTIGLFIDSSTDANWIAWDEVELQYVGAADKYWDDKTEAELGEIYTQLKEAVAKANAIIESVDLNGIKVEETELGDCLYDAEEIINNPASELATKEYIEELVANFDEAINNFYLSGVMPKEGESFDFTSFIKNPEFDTAPTEEEWTAESGELPGGTDCVYWWFGSSTTWNLVQDFSQVLQDMPAGNYLLDVQAGVRVDMNYSTANYTAENLPNYMTSCKVYANEDSTDVHPFFYEDEAKGLTLESMLAMTNDYDYRHGNGTLIDYMLKESGHFHSYVPFTLDEVQEIKVGFHLELPAKAGQMPFIDYFHLSYFGNQEIDLEKVTSIESVIEKTPAIATGIYNLNGQLMRRGTSTEGLAKGLYIINGKKVFVR